MLGQRAARPLTGQAAALKYVVPLVTSKVGDDDDVAFEE
jgi:hypothetical protein